MHNLDFDILDLCAPGIRGLKPYEPGKPISDLQREYHISDIIKLASNENPLGPSPKVIAAVRQACDELAIYPDGQTHELRTAIARRHSLAPECITFGDGSDQCIELLTRCFLQPGTNAVISRHAFAVYAIVSQAVGAEIHFAEALSPSHPSSPYGHDLDAMAACIDEGTRVVFIANPNNPTGTWLDQDAMLRFLESVPRKILVVVDEAYSEYVEEPGYPDCVQWLERFPNLIVTRTFSKAYGLAGLRIGYAVSHPQVAELMNRIRQPFNVNKLAPVAALAALSDQQHLLRSLQTNRAGMRQLEQGLKALGLKWIPSICNFLTVDFARPAMPIYQALLRQGIIVRPVENYGLPNHLRISIGLPEQNLRLLAALKQVLGS
ncbi:MAG: histidinol-phosphate transaminase [Gammaproteobacteria bacterium]|nr:histidinol-phosphate transaminase [Gammaproteobacteria bacterium]MDE2344925.1 histidinol-phosphate transaminase [Gammaproteobacteria bacterium]